MQPTDGTETLVIDCSLTMAWYFKDEATPYTNAVRASLATERAVVPAHWPLEVANVLLMAERRKRSNPTRATKWLRYPMFGVTQRNSLRRKGRIFN
jgi:predicted nucleic acid-binding protein